MKVNDLFQDKFLILIDQSLVSLLSFGAVFLLSKLASVSVFADFVLVYSYASFVFIFISYFISSPVLVFIPKKWKSNLLIYIISLLILAIIGTFAINFICRYFINIQVKNVNLWAFLGLSLGMIVNDLLKKTIFASKVICFHANVVSSIFLVGSFFALTFYFSNELSLNLILTLYSISYLGAICITAFSLIKWGGVVNHPKQPNNNKIKTFAKIFKEHYVYSKWIIAGGILFWVYSQGVFILGDALGVDELGTAKVRSIQNLLGLFTILLAAMESYYIPLFSQKTENLSDTVHQFYKNLNIPLIGLFFISLPLVYGVYYFVYEEKYGNGFWIIFIIWVSQIITVYSRPLAMALKAKEITSPLFYTHLFASLALIIIGSMAIIFLGDIGLALAIFISFLSSNAILVYYYRKFIKNT
ncbi:polysaccharide biosynthesis protein [Moheibacter lacus]|uniref:Membrane protein involved in the export of O-antigen and teichoic acid n=1 Tax=Moheibacter lacus TaxID=2745851 RepID=A0A838ZMX8_9FLAO|nr:hypothetical protein [Moheibacter lacus]MBA5629200.1 hypothetical protein [Moheibacter lacus]